MGAALRIRTFAPPSGVRGLLLLAVASSAFLAGCGSHHRAAFKPAELCKRSAFLPPPVQFPAGFPAWAFYSLKPSANAAAHHALCRVAISTPRSRPPYEFDVAWYAFPSHAEAVADLKAFDLGSLYTHITGRHVLADFPGPNLMFSAIQTGRRTTVVSFVEGDAVASGYVYGGGTSAQALSLARWALADLRHLEG